VNKGVFTKQQEQQEEHKSKKGAKRPNTQKQCEKWERAEEIGKYQKDKKALGRE